ncbi:PLP-dependent aminotransferase family protein [Actinoplanes sp. LDG1-06]|uniref:PLP-dependent aminotransferase family protein n=1 Tax=Paractinoplanes ovalisporus TaxID=2810368 RepID=A0ABS2A7X3_9ACTN|nr:PLP-dependent aminotransferase family protein [Actinoplanes ovalisporus]MBM2615941.1 PLP-dependent aminotransferase family protein [Actinoplanes ovalisporus]
MTIVQFEHRDGILDLGWGHPLPSLLPTGAWAAASEATLRTYGWKALTYGHEPGPGPLREWIAERTGEVGATFVTAGASHGLALITQVLTRPGDVVMVDSPTYHYAFKILTDLGVELVPVHADDPDEVRSVQTKRQPRFLYVVPTFSNPTGASLSVEIRQIHASNGVTLVEDDPYNELYYETPPPRTDKTQIRLGSFAKTVAPGLRLGWITATPDIVTRLAHLGYVHSGGGVNHTTALTMAEFGRSGAFDRHVQLLRDRYRQHRDALADALDADRPAGGWFLWLKLPEGVDAESLLPVAEQHGTSFVPGPAFFVDRQGGHDHVRLSFSHLPPAELTEAARRLRVAIRSVLGQ